MTTETRTSEGEVRAASDHRNAPVTKEESAEPLYVLSLEARVRRDEHNRQRELHTDTGYGHERRECWWKPESGDFVTAREALAAPDFEKLSPKPARNLDFLGPAFNPKLRD